MKTILTVFLACAFTCAFTQNKINVVTEDIHNFWEAYDNMLEVDNFSDKLSTINKIYLDKQTAGLKKFRQLNNYKDTSYIKMLENYPSYFQAIRSNMHKLATQKELVESAFSKFETLYHDLQDVNIYFTVGCFNSGGTISDNMILLGAEILSADSTINFEEKNLKWLKDYAETQKIDNIDFFTIHEYVHILQKKNDTLKPTVLSACIGEGAADFVAELATEKPLNTPYRRYGEKHFRKIKEDFRKEMLSTEKHSNWLYNGHKFGEAGDLGYFLGYVICKSYYEQAIDKKQAIKEIIEVDYNDENAIETFLDKSKFYQ
ncbi:DUF2268 domain-containing putative Zn-dependent protease [Sphingobacterium corticis]